MRTVSSRLRRYGFALLILAAGVVVASTPAIRDEPASEAIVAFFVVMIAAWYGGLGPGLLDTALIILLYSGTPYSPAVALQFALFVAGGALISALAEVLHAARRRVEAHQLWLSAVLTSIGDAVIATDARGRVAFTNPVSNALTGWEPGEAAGRPLEEVFRIVAEGSSQPVESPVGRVLREGVVVGLANHTVLITRDGSERPISDSAAPIRNGAGEVIGAVLVFRDDTERREHERQLQDASRRKDQFLAMLAHELRNPLAAIRSVVGLLDTPEAGRDNEWAREILRRQVDHLTHLLDDLLDVSRITRGMVTLRTRLIDAASVIRQTAETVRPMMDERGHRFEAEIAPVALPLEADPLRLEQILVNLLSNASRYTPPGGCIRLTAGPEGDQVVIRVEDTGVGIASEMLPQVFDLFAQGERSLARTEGGLGIGLTIVKGLVERHGGSVAAWSPGMGHGSVFTVRLPAAAGQLSPPDPPPTVPTPGRGARVLIVDDNRDLAKAIARLLRRRGNEVEMAHDGPEGIDVARSFHPDVVLLDLGLPRLDGYEVARRLRREEGFGGTLIIAISGYGQEEDRRRSRESGMDHHLVKPVDIATIAELIAQAGVGTSPR